MVYCSAVLLFFTVVIRVHNISALEDEIEDEEDMAEQCSALKSMKNYKGFDNEIAVNIEKTTRAIDIGPYKIVLDQDWHSQGIPAVVWDAGISMAEYLAKNFKFTSKTKILELGAGTGIISIVAAKMGANVVATDLSPVVPRLRQNLYGNLKGCKDCKYATETLDWGNNLKAFPYKKFDYIVGGDIIYHEKSFDKLLATFHHFCGKNTKILLAVIYRRERDRRFMNLMKQMFKMEKLAIDEKRETHIYRFEKL